MRQDIFQQTSDLVRASFELEAAVAPQDEVALLALLAQSIGDMLERRPDYLMSLLYRLDVLEEKIRPALQPDAPEPAHWGLARLVLERQQQRLETRRALKPKPLEGLEGWEW